MRAFWLIVLGVMMITESVAAEGDKPKIRTLAKGGFSGMQEAAQIVVTNGTQWAEVWKKHSVQTPSAKPAPKVDFEKESVVFVALGQKNSGGHAVEIVDVRKTDSKTEIVVKMRAPKPGGIQLQALTAPFHMVAVPKISGATKFKWESTR